jgi:hypothetical protein
MNRFGLIAVLLPAAAIADDQQVIAQPDSLKWTAAPPVLPKGAQIRVEQRGHGNPAERCGTGRNDLPQPGRRSAQDPVSLLLQPPGMDPTQSSLRFRQEKREEGRKGSRCR